MGVIWYLCGRPMAVVSKDGSMMVPSHSLLLGFLPSCPERLPGSRPGSFTSMT